MIGREMVGYSINDRPMKSRYKTDVTGLFEGKHTYAVRYIPPPFSVCTASFLFLHAIIFDQICVFVSLPPRFPLVSNDRSTHGARRRFCSSVHERTGGELLGSFFFVFGHRQENSASFLLRRKRTDRRVTLFCCGALAFRGDDGLVWGRRWRRGALCHGGGRGRMVPFHS